MGSYLDTPLTERDEGRFEAEDDAKEAAARKERERRARLSPHKTRIQALVDDLDVKIDRWDRSPWDDELKNGGHDGPAVWAAIDTLIAIHDTDGDVKRIGRARWLVRWVRNQAEAKLNT